MNVQCIGLNDKHQTIVHSLLRLLDGRNGIQWALVNAEKIAPDCHIVISRSDADFQENTVQRIHHILIAEEKPLLSDERQHFLADPFHPSDLLELLNTIEKDKTVFLSSCTGQSEQSSVRGKKISIVDLAGLRRNLLPLERLDLFLGATWIGQIKKDKTVKANPEFINERLVFQDDLSLYCQHRQDAHENISAASPLSAAIDIDERVFFWMLVKYFCITQDNLGLSDRSIIHLQQWPDFGYFRELGAQKGVLTTTSLLNLKAISLQAFIPTLNISESLFFQLLGLCSMLGCLEYEITEEQAEKTAVQQQTEQVVAPSVFTFVRRLRLKLGLF